MTDHKFTGDEIVELLRAYVERQCGKCNVKDLGTCCGSCFITPILQAADLINRQKAEIERLERIRAELSRTVESLTNESLTNKCADCAGCAQWVCDCSTIKSEAIKEFAQRLKANMSNIARMEYGGNIYFCVGYDLIDTLVKEMTEENK